MTVKADLWDRNLLHPFTIVKVAAVASVNSPCPPPGTPAASYPGVCTHSPRRSSTRDFAASDRVGRIDKSGAPYPFLATFRSRSPVLSPLALTPAARSWRCRHPPDNLRHPSHLPPVRPVRQWWALLPAVSGPCCWQMAYNPGSFLVFNRTPVGKRRPSTLGSVVFQQGQGLRVSVDETDRSIPCRQTVAEAS